MAVCCCHGTGVIVADLFPGAVLVQPCGCAAAAASREKAERELKEMHAEVRMLRGIYHAACVGNDPEESDGTRREQAEQAGQMEVASAFQYAIDLLRTVG